MYQDHRTPSRLGRRARRAAANTGFLITVVLAASAGITAAVVGPRFIKAAASDDGVTAAARPEHQQIIASVGAILGRAHQVLAVHERGATPFVEAVLWVQDVENVGAIDPWEIALLRHSRALRTIDFLELSADAREAAAADRRLSGLTETALADRSFCAMWRSHPLVRVRHLAVGISDAQMTWAEAARDGSPRLRISLIWADETTDSADAASVLVDVSARPAPAGGTANQE